VTDLPVTRTRFLIIGGGITNLAFAAFVDSDDYWVCEAQSDVGGYCRTIHQDGFVWDYSGHFFHFRHKEIEDLLVNRIGPDRVRHVVKDSRIWFKGVHVDFPFQKNIHQLPREDFLDCLVGLFEKHDTEPSANFKEMLYAKFGKGISDRFLVPYNEKLYATDLSRLDTNAMGRFFPHADPKEIILGFRTSNNQSYNATFTYPEGGAIEYVRALQQDVLPKRISLNEPVLSLDLERKRALTPSRVIQYDHVVSAVPFPRLLQMARMEHDPSIYSWNKVLVFNLGFNKKGPRSVHWIYYPERDLCFYRVGFYDNIFDTPRMSLYVEIGYPADAELDDSRISKMKARVLHDLERAGVIDDHQLVSSHQVVLDPAYVHITQRSLEDVKEKQAHLAARDVHSLGRYGSWTYCSIEDNILEARALAGKFGGQA
jgi:protoporphyrinogen oxidase